MFENFSKILELEKNITKIVIAGCFNCYFISQSKSIPNPGDKYNYYYLSGDKKFFFRTSEGKGQQKAFIGLFNFIQDLSTKYQIIFIGDNPSSENFNPKVMMAHEIRGDSVFFKKRYPNFSHLKFVLPNEQVILDEKLKTITQINANYISLNSIICPDGFCNAKVKKNIPIYKDDDHIRPFFVKEIIGPYLIKYLK